MAQFLGRPGAKGSHRGSSSDLRALPEPWEIAGAPLASPGLELGVFAVLSAL